jgi:hypothetical protein
VARPKKEFNRILSADQREITFEGSVVGSDRELVSLLLKVADGERHVKTACDLVERFGPLLPSVGEGDGDAHVVPMDVIDNVASFAGYASRLSLTSMGLDRDREVVFMSGDGSFRSKVPRLQVDGSVTTKTVTVRGDRQTLIGAGSSLLATLLNEVQRYRYVPSPSGPPIETLEAKVLFSVFDAVRNGLLVPCTRCSRPVIMLGSKGSPFCSKVCGNSFVRERKRSVALSVLGDCDDVFYASSVSGLPVGAVKRLRKRVFDE